MKLKKSLSQNFLKCSIVAKKIANRSYGNIFEIGAGNGFITSFLTKKANKLYANELDPYYCKKLKEKFSSIENIELICTDFLKIMPFKVDVIVGNIPFHISSTILFKLKEWEFKEAFLIFQKEFAERMIAKPGSKKRGRLSITAQLNFKIQKLMNIKASCFYPKPDVDAVLLQLIKKDFSMSPFLETLIKDLFNQKNKKIRRLNKKYYIPKSIEHLRPFQLTIKQILSIKKKESGD